MLGIAILHEPSTTVLPVFHSLAKLGTQWVAFDITQDSQKMLVIFNRESLESTLIKMPRTLGLVMRMPTHRVRVRKPSEEIR